jgi:uncharacterized protein YacL
MGWFVSLRSVLARRARLAERFYGRRAARQVRLLDLSVIVDGRIGDICETGFIDGTLVIPRFVVTTLEALADAPDALRCNRGHRGLDVLQRLQEMASVDVIVSDIDFAELRDLGQKLVETARQFGGKIITNDATLHKVAKRRGVEILNVNDLANALKPVVLPGEMMSVFILKEGKEPDQGVAYLDDGTMVVVDHALAMIGQTVDIVVTSVLQTTAGKMIFGRSIEHGTHPQAHAPTGSGGDVVRRLPFQPAHAASSK